MGNKEVMRWYGESFLSLIEEKVESATGFNWLSPVYFSKGMYAFKGGKYHGINQFYLSVVRAVKEYESACWITWNKKEALRKATKKNIRLKEGAKGYPVVFWKQVESKDAEGNKILNSAGNPKTFPVFRYSTVFNIDQLDLDGVDLNLPELQRFTGDITDMEEWDDILLKNYKGNKPAIIHDQTERNFYRPSSDEIHLCKYDRFKSVVEYLATSAHEMAHSTGIESRLNRYDNASFGNLGKYAREELSAEMGSCRILAKFGIFDTINNSAEYMKGWLQPIKDEPECLVNAFRDSDKILKWIFGDEEEEEDHE